MDSELQTENKELKVDVLEEMTDSHIKIEIDDDNTHFDSGCSHLQNVSVLQQNIDSGLEHSHEIVKVEDVDYSHCFERIDSDFGDINGLHDRNQNTGSSSISQGVESDKEKTLTPYFGESSNIFVYKNTDSGSQDNDTVGEDLLVDVINIKQETNNTQENILELEDNNCHDPEKCSSTCENPEITEERNETVTIDNSVVDLACDNHGAENSPVNFSDLNSEKGSTRHETSGLKPDDSHSSASTTNDAAYDILGQFKFADRSYAIVKVSLKNQSIVKKSDKRYIRPNTDLIKEKMLMMPGTSTMDFMNKTGDSTTGSLDSGVVVETEHQSFQCSVCKMEFKNTSLLTNHLMSHKTEHANQCCVCGKTFENSHTLERHMVLHSSERPFPCNACDKGFKTIGYLRKHMASHRTEKPYGCNICDKKFQTVQILKTHMSSHKKNKRCDVCKKEFKTQSHLKTHMINHSTERPHQCSVCGKGFKSVPVLNSHMVTHSTEIPHQCSVCGKGFKSVGILTRHMVTHSDERPHLCSVCGKDFKCTSTLGSHMITHRTEKPHSCNICDKKCKTVLLLRAHMVSHSTERPHQCSLCGKDFKTSHHLKQHIIRHSDERPHQCSMCGNDYKNLRNLRRHMISHSIENIHQCLVCDQTFKSDYILVRHIKRRHKTATSAPSV